MGKFFLENSATSIIKLLCLLGVLHPLPETLHFTNER